MRNKTFTQASDIEKKSKLARVLKSKTALDDAEIIKAVNSIDLHHQYSIRKVSPMKFVREAQNRERILNKTDDWEEKIVQTARVLSASPDGGICVIEKNHIGCLDLNKSERRYEIIVF